MNAKTLALRDPALACLVGAIGGSDFGAEFSGGESDFGAEFSGDFDDDDDLGAEFSGMFGADASMPLHGPGLPPAAVADARHPASPMHPANQPKMLALWQRHHMQASYTARRERLLEPNKGSSSKIERYVFSINQTVTLGAAVALVMSGQPDTNIRPQRVTMNAPAPGFATISEIKVANVSVTVGGIEDAFDFAATGVGQQLDMPTLSPANRATVLGNYTGFVPPGYVGATPYLFVASFKGPASIVA